MLNGLSCFITLPYSNTAPLAAEVTCLAYRAR